MAAGAYSRGVLNILNGTIDLDTTALKFMLASSAYTYNPDHSASLRFLCLLLRLRNRNGRVGCFRPWDKFRRDAGRRCRVSWNVWHG